MPATKKCPTCGTENASEVMFCFGCGERFDSPASASSPVSGHAPTICPTCKTTNAPNAISCARCGTSLLGVKRDASSASQPFAPTRAAHTVRPAPQAVPAASAPTARASFDTPSQPVAPAAPVAEATAPKVCVCRKCKFENNPDFNFCAKCGTKLAPPPPPKIVMVPGKCIQCGVQNDPTFVFCAGCGAKLGVKPKAAAKKTSFAAAGTAEEKTVIEAERTPLMKLIRNSALLFLAVIMTLFALLPIFSVSYTVNVGTESSDVKISFSAIDSIVCMLDIFKDDNDDLLDKHEDLYKKYNNDLRKKILALDLGEDSEITGDIYDYDESYSDNFEYVIVLLGAKYDEVELEPIYEKALQVKKSYAEELAVLEYRAMLADEGYELRVSDIVATAAAVIYLAIAVVLLAFATVNFIFHFLGKRSFFKVAFSLLLALGCISPAMLLAMGPLVGSANPEIGISLVAMMACAAVATVAILVERIIIDKCGFNMRAIFTRTLSTALAVAMIVIAFSGIVTIKISKASYTKYEVGDKKATFSISLSASEINSFLNLTKSERSAYPKKITKSIAKENLAGIEDEAREAFLYNTKAEITSGEANENIYGVARRLIIFSGGLSTASIISLTAVAALAMALTAGFILWQTLLSVANGRVSKKAMIPARLASILAGGALLALSIMFSLYAKTGLDLVKAKQVSVSIGSGTIIYLVIALIHFFIPFTKKHVEEVFEYDEEDFAA